LQLLFSDGATEMNSEPRTRVMTLGVIGSVVIRPGLWVTACIQAARLMPNGWWRRAPFLPIPPDDYVEFRLVTQYGGNEGSVRPSVRSIDVVDYLRWCKQWNRDQS